MSELITFAPNPEDRVDPADAWDKFTEAEEKETKLKAEAVGIMLSGHDVTAEKYFDEELNPKIIEAEVVSKEAFTSFLKATDEDRQDYEVSNKAEETFGNN